MKPLKYDDIKWHLNDEFPQELKPEAALTHIGIFMGWVLDCNLESDLLKSQFQDEILKFKNRELKGSEFVKLCCDNKLTSDDMNNEGNHFAKYYYESEFYMRDYVDRSDDNNDSIFEEPNSWDKYNEIAEQIQQHYENWKNRR